MRQAEIEIAPSKKLHWQLMLAVLALFSLIVGCSATAHLQEGQLLLKNEPSFQRGKKERVDTIPRNPFENLKELGLSTIDPALLSSSIKTHPNRRMIWPKTYLHLYNLGLTLRKYEYPPETAWEFFFPSSALWDSIPNFLIHTAGEPPVLVDTALLRQDCENLRNVYFSQGFFNTNIHARVDTLKGRINRQKANVTFVIEEGRAAILDRIRFEVTSDSVRKILFKTLGDSYLRTGDTYQEDKLSQERNRITEEMRNNGFFTFNPRLISYEIDTLPVEPRGIPPNNPAINDYFPVWVTVIISEVPLHYKVGQVSMRIEPAQFDPERDTLVKVIIPEMMSDSLREAWDLNRRVYPDTAEITYLVYERSLERINLRFLEKLVDLHEGETYSVENERSTQRRLQGLGIFKYVLVKQDVDTANQLVNVLIQANFLPKFQMKVGVEGFFQNDPILKSNLPGIGGQVGYLNKMVFKGAEKLDLKAQGSVRFYQSSDTANLQAFWEGTATASMIFPRIIAPFMGRIDMHQSNPNTTFSLSYIRQQSRDYNRNATSVDWNYSWFDLKTGRPKVSHSFSPYTITVIQSFTSPAFRQRIAEIQSPVLRSLIEQDYRPRFSSVGRYRYTYSNYMGTRRRPTFSLQPTIEIGGNTPYLMDRFLRPDSLYTDHKIDNLYYGQFIKGTLEFKTYLPISTKNEFVIRTFVGVADPWNYTPFVPFESRFFSGGTNSMRGWQSNTLGPGTYDPSTADESGEAFEFLLSPGGEVIFETNFELRQDVYKWIELAIFTDIGNVWFLPGSKVEAKGANLSPETYLQLGIDAGIGFRLDFSFFIFRLDLAQQVYSPSLQDFVVKYFPRDLGGKNFQINFGVGYPF